MLSRIALESAVVLTVGVAGCGATTLGTTVPLAFRADSLARAERALQAVVGHRPVTAVYVASRGVEVEYIDRGRARDVGWLYADQRVTRHVLVGVIRTFGGPDRAAPPFSFPTDPTVPSEIYQRIHARADSRTVTVEFMGLTSRSWTISGQDGSRPVGFTADRDGRHLQRYAVFNG